MFKVKDFWAVPEYAELLQQLNQRIYPYMVGGEGTAKETLDATRSRLERDVQEVRPRPVSDAVSAGGGMPCLLRSFIRKQEEQSLGDHVMTTLDPALAGRRARLERHLDPQPASSFRRSCS